MDLLYYWSSVCS